MERVYPVGYTTYTLIYTIYTLIYTTTTHNSSIRSDEGLTLETSAFYIFHGGNSTFINSFDKTKFLLKSYYRTNGFYARPKRYTNCGGFALSSEPQKISRRRLADYVRKLHQKACRTCSTINFPRSTNQSVVVADVVVIS